MPKPDLNDYFYFFHVVEQRGFAPAARVLGIPKSRLSRHIRTLEARLETRLLQRTSRQFAVTDAGMTFFQHAKAVVEEVNAAEAKILDRHQELTGKVRLSCSVGVAQFALKTIIADFVKTHPKVEIGQLVTNENVDLIKSGVDLVIRGHVDTLPDSSLIQTKLARVRWGLVASSRYLERTGLPTSPADLSAHQGLCVGWRRDLAKWTLKSDEGQCETIQFVPKLSSDDMLTLKDASAAGLGIVSLPLYVCRNDLAAGQLVHVLAKWTSGYPTLSLLRPSRRGAPPVVKALASYLTEKLPGFVE